MAAIRSLGKTSVASFCGPNQTLYDAHRNLDGSRVFSGSDPDLDFLLIDDEPFPDLRLFPGTEPVALFLFLDGFGDVVEAFARTDDESSTTTSSSSSSLSSSHKSMTS